MGPIKAITLNIIFNVTNFIKYVSHYLKYDASNPAGYITSSALSGYTPTSRTITINGATQDLSSNRTWTISAPTKTSDLTNDSGFITSSALSGYLQNNVGIAGGTTLIGGTASGNNLTLVSTSNATKGKILFGNYSAYDEANNRLGIGTTTPANLLSILGNSATPGGVSFDVKNSNAYGDTRFSLSNSSNKSLAVSVTGSSYAAAPSLSNGAYLFTNGGLSNMTFMTDGDVGSGGSGYISFATGGSMPTQERMRITSTGNIGIGTTTPANILSILGNSGTPGGVSFDVKNSNASGNTQFSLSNSSNKSLAVSVTGSSYAASPSWINGAYLFTMGGLSNMSFVTDGDVEYGGSGYISFATGGFLLATQERMRITSTGNIGIGTKTPNASAILDLVSTTGGLSIPTMNSTSASAIASPKKSLMIYVTDINGTFTSAGWWGYNGTVWKLILAE